MTGVVPSNLDDLPGMKDLVLHLAEMLTDHGLTDWHTFSVTFRPASDIGRGTFLGEGVFIESVKLVSTPS